MGTSTEARTERGIIFSIESVRAILKGAKTQTRRVVRWKVREEGLNLAFSGLEVGHYWCDSEKSGWVLRSRSGRGTWNDRTHPIHCPYGRTGGLLWVKERWVDAGNHYRYPATDHIHELRTVKSSRVMRRSVSRIDLELLAVRVQRLWEISEEEALAEGIHKVTKDGALFKYCVYDAGLDMSSTPWQDMPTTAREAYAAYWDKINAKRGLPWKSNPWVWALTFRTEHVADALGRFSERKA